MGCHLAHVVGSCVSECLPEEVQAVLRDRSVPGIGPGTGKIAVNKTDPNIPTSMELPF